MKKCYLLSSLIVVMLFSTLGTAQAQGVKITGTISDADGPLIGATVVEKGTANGATTDINGYYELTATENAVLVYSFIGYFTQEISISGRTVVDVTLETDVQSLQEVVVVGYGTTVKPEFTGSIISIKKDAIVNVVASNPTTALQGRLAGVQVESFGGQPGGSANVFIRGVNSLSNASPLFIVDGLFVDNMDYINPNDIENISVLKDAAASAIYGARAANGVILITTNHGTKGKAPTVSLNTRVGFDTPSKRLDYINGQQYTDYLNQRFANDGESTSLTWNGVDTDWQDESLSTGFISDVGVSISGGGENSSYYISGNHFYQDGILTGSNFERINLRANSTSKFGKFTLTESIGITEGQLQENNWFGWDGVASPTLGRTNENNEGGFEAPSDPIHGPGGVNQLGLATLEDNLTTTRTLFGSAKLD
ncbi:MAG: SusC/RagA family TonB-linked outer membrane protein, partial [Bacteroidota bacterium]